MSYDAPIYQSYSVLANAAVSSEADMLVLSGPKGRKGRIVSASAVVTTGVTVAAGVISFGDGTDEDAYGTLSVPVSAAGSVANTLVDGVDSEIPANGAVTVHGGGEATAGAVNLFVTVAWY